jgi:hypothetical protein
MAVTLSGSVGEGGKNHLDDVRKVRALLDTVGMTSGILGKFGRTFDRLASLWKLDEDLRSVGFDGFGVAGLGPDIMAFQKILGLQQNGLVEPGGTTLKKLNWLASPLAFQQIAASKRIQDGGYRMKLDPSTPMPPSPYRTWVGRPEGGGFRGFEVSGRPGWDLMSGQHLSELLKLVDRLDCWASPMEVHLIVTLNAHIVSISKPPATLIAPVRPHNGRLLRLDEAGNGPALTYQGDPSADQFWGRWLVKVDGYDKYLFGYRFDPANGKSRLETDASKRGFDCTTYAGSVCVPGLDPRHMNSSVAVANAAGATACSVIDPETNKQVALEGVKPKLVKEFFKANKTGYYLLWSSGHIVIVANGEVHEFSGSAGGYRSASSVTAWLEPYDSTLLTVRKLGSKPPLAA